MTAYPKVSLFSLCALFCVSVFGNEVQQLEGPQPMRVAARHIEPGGIGYNQGYTTLEGFFSPMRPYGDVWVPFLDLRGHVFNNGRTAANAGVGVRYIACSRVWGLNSYYDYRRTYRQHYNQVAAGLESLGRVWDFRINGYLPVGKKTSAFWGSHFEHFRQHYAIISGKKEFAMKGADAEAAAHINVVKNVDLTLAMGPYYLNGHGESAWGGKARAELDLFKYCKLEGFTSYDSIFKWTGQAQVSLVAPFGAKRKIQKRDCQSAAIALALANRSVQPVYRFEIIPTHRKKTKTKAINPSTGKPYFFWFVDNTSHSKGTYESPFPTLIAAQIASKPGDVIYVYPGDGTSQGLDAGIVLKNNQFLFGSGIAHKLNTTSGGMTIPQQTGGWPILTAPVGSSVVTVASHNFISGLQVTSDAGGTIKGSYCIGSFSGTTNDLSVSSNVLTANNGAEGIDPSMPSGKVKIKNNTVLSGDGQGAYAIYLSQMGGKGNYTVKNNTISNFQNDGLNLADIPSGTAIAIVAQNQSRVHAVVSGNQISDCVGHAIDFHATTGSPMISAIVSGNHMEGVPLKGLGAILFADDDATITFALLNNRVNEFVFGFIAQAEGNSTMRGLIQHNVLSNGPLGSGIVLDTNFIDQTGSATGVFSVISNDISRYGDAQGVATAAYGNSSLTALIQNNYIHEIGKAGIFSRGFVTSKTNLMIYGNTIAENFGGIEADCSDDAAIHVVMQGNKLTNNFGAGLFGNPIMNGHANYEILGNTFTGNNQGDLNTGSAVTILAEDASTVCLRMQYNQSTLEATQPDYDLENMGSSQFSVEPLTGNTGTLNQSGTTSVPQGYCGP